MAFCISCGSELFAGAKFCHQCGTPLPADESASAGVQGPTRDCPECGNTEPATKKFCGQCGSPLDSQWLAGPSDIARTQSTPVPAPEPPQSEAAPEVAAQDGGLDEIVDLGTIIQAEKRNVTVIFGDISGFTALSETIDAEEVREIMNRCFDGMVQSVKKYEGTVDKFIGDCIMVVFGAPVTHEDDPERAVRCAIEMQAYLQQVNKTLSKTLGMRIGINAGEAVAGGVGGTGRMDYTVMGDTVNLAQRLESNARVGHILVSRSVERLTASTVRYKGLEPIKVKGKQRPIEVFEVRGLVEGERSDSSVFVGRAGELAQIAQDLGRVASGEPVARLFVGEAGMGKSRLLAQVAEQAAAQGFLIARAAGGRFATPAEFDLVRQAVSSLCEDGRGGGEEPINEKLERLSRFGVEADQIGRLQHLLGTAAPTNGFEREEARLMDRAAIFRVFQGAAAQGGLCLLVDDAHLADATSRELIDELIDSATGLRLFVVGTARPEAAAGVLSRAQRINLGSLSGGEVVALAREQVARAELPETVAQVILERALGSPFYAIELIRHFIDQRALLLTAGKWQITDAFDPNALPEGMGWMVAARLDQLSEQAATLLRYAALIGRVFSEELLIDSLGEVVDAQTALGECVHRQILVSCRRPAGSYRFTQDMVHQAVVQRMVKSETRQIHRKIAEAMEARRKSDPLIPIEAIAEHFLEAAQKRKAARYFALAGDRLTERGAVAGAMAHFERSIDLSLELTAHGATLNEAAATQLLLLAARAVSAQTLMGPAKALTLANRVLEQIPADRAPRARARLLRERGEALLKASKPHEADESFEEAIKTLGEAEPGGLATQLRADRAASLEARGKLELARKLLLDGLDALSSLSENEGELRCQYYNQLGRVLLRWKEIEGARQYFGMARAEALRSGNEVTEGRAVANLAGTVASQGKTQEAQALFAEALELAHRSGDRIGTARIHYNLGRLFLVLGQRAEAEGRLTSAKRLASELGWREGMATAIQALNALRAKPARTAAH